MDTDDGLSRAARSARAYRARKKAEQEAMAAENAALKARVAELEAAAAREAAAATYQLQTLQAAHAAALQELTTARGVIADYEARDAWRLTPLDYDHLSSL